MRSQLHKQHSTHHLFQTCKMKILPWILCQITRHPRSRVRAGMDFQWTNSMVHNLFRIYELIFWRREGIRREVSAIVGKGGKQYTFYHSWESLFAFCETCIKRFVSAPFKKIPVFNITIPIMWTTTGMPVISSPYLFAIAFVVKTDPDQNTGSRSTASLTIDGTGTNSVMVGFASGFNSSNCLSATFNSSSMTNIDSSTYSLGNQSYIFIILPSQTSASAVCTSSPSGRIDWGVAVYSGCNQSVTVDSHSNGTGLATSHFTHSTTVVASNCWLFASIRNDQTNVVTYDSQTHNMMGIQPFVTCVDSNTTVGTGSQAQGETTGIGATNWWFAMMSVAPASATATVNVSTLPFMGAG